MSSDTPKKPIFVVQKDEAGQRLDNFLLKHCKQLEKNICYKLIRKGQVRVNGKRIKPLQKLQTGDQVRVPPFVFFVEHKIASIPERLQQELLECVLFENESYLVVDKPAGLPSHTGTGHEIGVIETIRSIPEYQGLHLAHRLDKDTSGCLLLAKSRQALLEFQSLMKRHEVFKTYVAVTDGVLDEEVVVNQPLNTKNRVHGKRMVIVSVDGSPAKTRITPIKSTDKISLVSCQISSGRTHQIRVHCQYKGVPILGDVLYGKAQHKLPRKLYLHATKLSFGNYLLESPVPAQFESLFQ